MSGAGSNNPCQMSDDLLTGSTQDKGFILSLFTSSLIITPSLVAPWSTKEQSISINGEDATVATHQEVSVSIFIAASFFNRS